MQSWKAQLGIICGQEANHSKLQFCFGIWRHTSDHLPPWCNNEGTSLTEKRMQWFFDFLLKHLKLRLSVWLGKAELLNWRSLRKAGNVLPVLATLCGWGSIMCLKYLAKSTQVLVQSCKAQLATIAGTCEQRMCHYDINGAREAIIIKLQFGFGIWRHTSDHLPPWCNNEGSSLEKEYLFDFLLKHLKLRLSVWLGKTELISWHSLCKACSVLPVLATLCGWGSIMCFKYFWQKALKCWWLLVQCWKAQLDIVCGQEASHLPPWRNNESASLTGKRIPLFFDFLLKHLKLRLSVWLGKAELLSWHSLSTRPAMCCQS